MIVDVDNKGVQLFVRTPEKRVEFSFAIEDWKNRMTISELGIEFSRKCDKIIGEVAAGFMQHVAYKVFRRIKR